MAVSVEDIKKLKELTGIGLTDAKAALVEANGDFDKALEAMRKKGLTKADLIDAVYHRHGGLTKAEASEIVEAIFATVKTTLGDGRPVRIKNFGNF